MSAVKKNIFFSIIVSVIFSSLLYGKNRVDRQIQDIAISYHKVIEFVLKIEEMDQVTDQILIAFFTQFHLYKKNNISKLDRSINFLKKINLHKNIVVTSRNKLLCLIESMLKVQSFIEQHDATFMALIMHHEIVDSYGVIDLEDEIDIEHILKKSKKNAEPKLKDRRLYFVVKKIGRDIRQLIKISNNNIPAYLLKKIDETRQKLIALKNKIITSSLYKSQVRMVLWMNSIIAITLLLILIVPLSVIIAACPAGSLFGSSCLWLMLPVIVFEGVVALVIGYHLISKKEYRLNSYDQLKINQLLVSYNHCLLADRC